MKKFRRSEVVFMIVGLVLIISSLFLLLDKFSVVKFFNLHLSPGDPFAASYYAKPLTSMSPAPTLSPVPSPTPLAAPEETKELSIYLDSPINQALIPSPKNQKQRLFFILSSMFTLKTRTQRLNSFRKTK